MRPATTALVTAQHPLDRHPPPTGLTPIPAIEVHPTVPARRTRRRPRHLDTTGRGQPGLDRYLQHEYDLQRLRNQPTTPGRSPRRGGQPRSGHHSLAAPHPNRNST